MVLTSGHTVYRAKCVFLDFLSKVTEDVVRNMTLVEGFGDEVISAVVICVVVGLVTLLWHSTHVRDRPPVRAVVIRAASPEDAAAAAAQVFGTPNEPEPGEEPAQQEEQPQEVVEQASNEETIEEETNSDGVLAKIRLQFINETSLEVRERLTERLGRFKSRHLDQYLSLTPEDRVRLIFNGRVLGTDQSTLAELGLTDNCVVHCLVQRGVGRHDVHSNDDGSGAADNNNYVNNDMDLSNVCYPVLGSVLLVIWWCQVVYAHYFTFTSTLSLVSLTVLYCASVTNTYFYRA